MAASVPALAQPLAFSAARQQLQMRSDRLAASRLAVESADLRHEAMQGLGGPVVSLSGASYAYHANLDVSLDPLNQTLQGALAALPAALQPMFASMPSLPSSYTLERNNTQTSASVSAVMPLYTGGATDAIKGVSQAQADEARADAAQTSEEVQQTLVERYFGAQLAAKAAALRDAALAGVEQHDSAADKMLQAGVIAKVERLQARSALEDARRQARKARDDAELAATALTRIVGAPERVTPASPLFVSSTSIGPLDQFVEAAMAHHPGLAKVAAKKTQAEQMHAAEEGMRRPQVFAFGQRQLKAHNADWVAGIGVRWTLYDSLDRETLAQATLRQAEQAEHTARQARDDIALLVEKRWQALEQARQQYLAMQPSVELADEVLRLRTVGLREGTNTPLELIDAQLNQAKVLTERAQAAYAYDKALSDLLASCGQSEEFDQYMARADIKVE
jgi:outer membrane protein TolC